MKQFKFAADKNGQRKIVVFLSLDMAMAVSTLKNNGYSNISIIKTKEEWGKK